MESYPVRDKSTLRDRFMLRHKHIVGTDLEAPVVWLLLRGEEERKTKSRGGRKGDREGGREGDREGDREGERKEKGLSVRHFFLRVIS